MPRNSLQDVLEAVAIRVGAGDLGCDLGAIQRCRISAQILFRTATSKRAKWKIFKNGRVFQQGLEARGLKIRGIDLDNMGIAVTR